MSKKLIAIRLSDEAIRLLKILADKQLRSQGAVVEILIKEAAKKEKIK